MKKGIFWFVMAAVAFMATSCSKGRAYYESKSKEYINNYNSHGNLSEKEWQDAADVYSASLDNIGKDLEEVRNHTEDYLSFKDTAEKIVKSYAESNQLGFLLYMKRESLPADAQQKINNSEENLKKITEQLEQSFIQSQND